MFHACGVIRQLRNQTRLYPANLGRGEGQFGVSGNRVSQSQLPKTSSSVGLQVLESATVETTLASRPQTGKSRVESANCKEKLEARVGIEPTIKVLQTSPLPLGYRALDNPILNSEKSPRWREGFAKNLERETGFEPATSTLARSHSTTELLPLGKLDYKHPATPAATLPKV